ncbi:MAG: Rieske (2Fe-2S) protein [Chloroflexota bacterium]
MTKIKASLASNQLPEQGVVKFKLAIADDKTLDAFVVRYQGRAYAWLNYCPHYGVDLGGSDGGFWAADGQSIVCQLHKAHFRPDDGFCIEGPCEGDSLTVIPLEESEGVIRFY